MSKSHPIKQQGAALIISLLMLAVMTIIGVTAMSQSGLETLMAGNLQLQTNSRSVAENQLATAEQAVESSATIQINYFDHDPDIDPIDTLIQSAENNADTEYADNYIEYLGPRAIPGESIVIGRESPRAGSEIHLFRNTALHSNRDNGARRLVQSIYAIQDAPTESLNSGNGNGNGNGDQG